MNINTFNMRSFFSLYLIGGVFVFAGFAATAQVSQPTEVYKNVSLEKNVTGVTVVFDSTQSLSNARVMSTPNNNCTSPTMLTVGGSCVSISNVGNSFFGPQPSCYTGQTANQWFIFRATASNNFVRLTGSLGRCYSGLAIYGPYTSSNPGCPTAAQQLFCSKPTFKINDVTSIAWIVGDYYMIQVSDETGGPCGSSPSAVWCISVLNPVTCATCNSPCGPISTYNSTNVPASWAVETPKYAMEPVVPASTNSPTKCYTCKANNTSDNINMGSFSEGGTGFNSFTWTLYRAYNCAVVASGTLTSLTASGLICDTNYVLCISFNPGGQVDSISPYLYNATATCNILPIQLEEFKASYFSDNNSVFLEWSTASEKNNKYFTVERSLDAENWESVTTVAGAGTTDATHYYSTSDVNPYPGKSYYRLKQTDYDGYFTYSGVVSLNIPANYSVHLFPNPTNSDLTLKYSAQNTDPINVTITDLSGKVVMNYPIAQVTEGANNFDVKTSSLAKGMYFMKVSNLQKTFYLKFVKE